MDGLDLLVKEVERRASIGGAWQEYLISAHTRTFQLNEVSRNCNGLDDIRDALVLMNDPNGAAYVGTSLSPLPFGELYLRLAQKYGATKFPQTYLTHFLDVFTPSGPWAELDAGVLGYVRARVLEPVVAAVPAFGARETLEYFRALQRMCTHAGFAETVTRLPAKLACASLARDCLIGRMFSVGLAQGGMEAAHGVKRLAQMDPAVALSEARRDMPTVAALEEHHAHIIEALVRVSPRSQVNVLAYFAAVVRANRRQTAENRHKLGLNSLEFVYNCYAALERLCAPFVTLDRAQMSQRFARLDARFYATPLGAQLHDGVSILDGAQLTPSQDVANFVTMAFFTALALVEYAVVPIITGIEGRFETLTQAAEDLLAAVPQDPEFLALPEPQKKDYLDLLEHSIARMRAERAALTQRLAPLDVMQRGLAFGTFALCYAMATAQGDVHALEPTMPLTTEIAPVYAAMPAYVLSATTVMMTYFSRDYKIMTDGNRTMENQLVIDACIFFLSDTRIVKNPYVRMKVARLLHFGAVEVQLGDRVFPAVYSTNFATAQSCHRFLVPALMTFVVDLVREYPTMEFGDKVQAKKYAYHLFKTIWRIPFYPNALPAYERRFGQLFIQFAGCLVDDLGFYLDGAFTSLRNAHFLSLALARRDSQEDRDAPSGIENDTEPRSYADVRQRSEQDATLASHFFQIAEETASAMRVYSQRLPQLFGADEILNRTAIMLNNAIRQLIGPTCNELRAPGVGNVVLKHALADVLALMLNLRAVPGFARALARDERSYSKAIYEKCVRLCKKGTLVDAASSAAFEQLEQKVEEAYREIQEEDEDFDDVPEEYLDPLVFEIMANPVTLPVSKMNIDLATIKEHLLTHDTDPFNRVPLKLEEVVPNEKLRLEIEDFKRRKRAQRRGESEAAQDAALDDM